MCIREINRIEELAPYREAWAGLLGATPRAGFFQSLEWLEAYWRHFGSDQKLRVLVLEEGGAAAGFLPLVVRQEKTKVGALRVLTYRLDYWGSFYGPIGQEPDRVLVAGLEHLNQTGLGADLFEPRWVGEDLEEAEPVLAAAGRSPLRSGQDTTALVELNGDWEGYLASKKSKWRANLRRCRRLVEEQGACEHLRYRPEAGGDPRWDLYDECVRLAAASWQGSSTTGTTLSHEKVAPFLRDVHAAAAQSGCVDLNLLRVNGHAVAFAYNYVYRGNVFGLRAGYNPECKAAGAGGVLYSMAIEDSFVRGDWRYDLGPGHMECKRSWMTHAAPIHRLTCGGGWSLKRQLLRLKRQWDARASLAAEQSR